MEPKPTKELVSCGVEIMLDNLVIAEDKYPIEPSPCSELKRDAEEIKVDGTDDRQRIEPNPTKELVSCGVEMIFEMPDDKQPMDPKPIKELVSCGVEMILDRLVITEEK